MKLNSNQKSKLLPVLNNSSWSSKTSLTNFAYSLDNFKLQNLQQLNRV
jgi:hypothetical protein